MPTCPLSNFTRKPLLACPSAVCPPVNASIGDFFKTRDVWNSGDNTQSLPICGTDGFDWKSPRSFLRLEIKISAVGFCVVALLRTFSAFR